MLCLAVASPALANQAPALPNLVTQSPAQQESFLAAQAVMKHDYATAVQMYNQIIAANPNNIDAYISRGIVKREMKDDAGSITDGQAVLRLTEPGLQQNPNDALLYHQRGMGFRLVRDFGQATDNIQRAIQLSGGANPAWQNDLNALKLEQHIYQ